VKKRLKQVTQSGFPTTRTLLGWIVASMAAVWITDLHGKNDTGLMHPLMISEYGRGGQSVWNRPEFPLYIEGTGFGAGLVLSCRCPTSHVTAQYRTSPGLAWVTSPVSGSHLGQAGRQAGRQAVRQWQRERGGEGSSGRQAGRQ
jgi:hypothetical protein